MISGHFAPRPEIKMAAKMADEIFKLLIVQLHNNYTVLRQLMTN